MSTIELAADNIIPIVFGLLLGIVILIVRAHYDQDGDQ
jgi:hypothetical protein